MFTFGEWFLFLVLLPSLYLVESFISIEGKTQKCYALSYRGMWCLWSPRPSHHMHGLIHINPWVCEFFCACLCICACPNESNAPWSYYSIDLRAPASTTPEWAWSEHVTNLCGRVRLFTDTHSGNGTQPMIDTRYPFRRKKETVHPSRRWPIG